MVVYIRRASVILKLSFIPSQIKNRSFKSSKSEPPPSNVHDTAKTMGSLVCCYMLLVYAITYYLSLGHTQQGGGVFGHQSNTFSVVDGSGAYLKVVGLNRTSNRPWINSDDLMPDETYSVRS